MKIKVPKQCSSGILIGFEALIGGNYEELFVYLF
jgi:hypothetical protein